MPSTTQDVYICRHTSCTQNIVVSVHHKTPLNTALIDALWLAFRVGHSISSLYYSHQSGLVNLPYTLQITFTSLSSWCRMNVQHICSWSALLSDQMNFRMNRKNNYGGDKCTVYASCEIQSQLCCISKILWYLFPMNGELLISELLLLTMKKKNAKLL